MKYKEIRIVVIYCLSLVFLCSCATKQMNLNNASQEGDLKVVKHLIAEGALVEVKGGNSTTPLMFAAQKGHVDVVSFLLQQGADVHSVDASGYTAFGYALDNFHIPVAEVLLRNGADINAQSLTKQTVFMRAVYQENKEAINFLLKNGADVNILNIKGLSAIYFAAERDDLETVTFLVKHGAKIDIVPVNGMTLWMFAAYHGSAKVFSYLMERETDINRLTEEGYSALTLAAMGQADLSKEFNPSIMKQLISAGASTSINDKKGRSIIELAENEARNSEREISRKHDAERQKSARGMNQMAAANFASTFSNMGLFSSLSISPRIKEIKAVLDSAPK